MKYKNKNSGVEILLTGLTAEEDRFYRRALAYFESKMNWLSFDEFAFGPASPIYKGKRKPQEVVEHPLFLALKDMSIELGVRQGKIRRPVPDTGAEQFERQESPQVRTFAAGKRS